MTDKRLNCFTPQFMREQTSLCGQWQFVFDDEDVGKSKRYFEEFPLSKTICVPFTYETRLSGIGDLDEHSVVWYKRSLSAFDGRHCRILHFAGADYITEVWVNGTFIGRHEGGSCAFSFDITRALKGDDNYVVVRCQDTYDTAQPRGKQKWVKDPFDCWYQQTVGIWKPVWTEDVQPQRLLSVKMTPDIDKKCVHIDYTLSVGEVEVETEIKLGEILISRVKTYAVSQRFSQSIDVKNVMLPFKIRQWSPQSPTLYDVTFRVYCDGVCTDTVNSYFGMRKIQADNKGIRLNDSPVYLKLILAQNYWKSSGLTMPSTDAAEKDVDFVKSCGFNGVRIHQKIEDQRFLYLCDREGILVWAEFPATYEYCDAAIERLTSEWQAAVTEQYNHPSIIVWVPFNESWGIPSVFSSEKERSFTRGIYYLTKAMDGMRPVITNDGWEHTCSDIVTLHDYDGNGDSMRVRYGRHLAEILDNKVSHGNYKFAFAQGSSYDGQPIIVSEYGGIAVADGAEGWGYNGKVKCKNELLEKFDSLTAAIQSVKEICGYCYTQLNDVYAEVNGLMDFDHNPKIDPSEIKKVNDKRNF